MRQALLVEIGVEELPHSHLKVAVETLKRSIPQTLERDRLSFDGLQILGTPRRLVIYIKGLDTQQASHKTRVVGPAKAAALDTEEKPTQAYLGFLRSQNATEKEVSFQKIPNKKGEYLVIEKKASGKRTQTLLAGFLQEQLSNLPFTRKMHWGTSFEFSRPIRWLLVFFGEKQVSISLGGLRSSHETFGHRFIHPKPLRVKNISDYFQKIKKMGIVLDSGERQRMIREELQAAAGTQQAVLQQEYEDLIEEVAHLVEIPFFFQGKLSRHFLDLPEEVLVASLSKYQRIFALRDKNGKLKPSFLAVLNGRPAHLNKVREHYEWVLQARLVDSLFFFNEDKKEPLEKRLSGLKELKFHDPLGSFYDKSLRLETVCQSIAEKDLKLSEETCRNVRQAALDSKCDLLTKMVYEFPSLQGVMGHHYSLLEGKPPGIARAIEDQYYPKRTHAPVPATVEGTILALADRLDTLVGFFGVGIYPTGSEDPFGLRRASTGVIRILLEKKLPLSIDNLIQRSISSYQSSPNPPALGDVEELKKKVYGFLKERLVAQLKESFGSPGFVESVISCGDSNMMNVWTRLSQLDKIFNQSYFQQAAKVQERTQNILKTIKESLDDGEVKAELLTEQAEKDLWKTYQRCQQRIHSLIQEGEYKQATQIYAEFFFEPVHQFFDKVLVNAENPEIRRNRLKLCSQIFRLYAEKVADLSRLKFQ